MISQRYRDQPVRALRVLLTRCSKLALHPSKSWLLLSGSTDGLVNIYNTSISDEEDALYQVFNHGSSVQSAGFLNDSDVFVASHDEKFSIYQMTEPEENEENDATVTFGDVRPLLDCEYVISAMVRADGEAVVAVGNHRYVWCSAPLLTRQAENNQ